MVVLADEILESFFETDFTNTFRLEPVPMMDLPNAPSGLLGGIWDTITSDGSKKMFNRFTDEVGRAVGKHQIFHRPAIGRFTALEEPKARESLLTPTMRRSASKASLKSAEDSAATTVPPSSVSAPANLSIPEKDGMPSSATFSPMPTMFEAAATAAAFMERTPFAIDDARDEDEDSDEESVGGEDDVMDEVDAFLEAHDSGLTAAEQELAKGANIPVSLVRTRLIDGLSRLDPRRARQIDEGKVFLPRCRNLDSNCRIGTMYCIYKHSIPFHVPKECVANMTRERDRQRTIQ